MRTLISESVKKVGEVVTLKGWVNTIREHGKVVFVDLRDRSGIVQIVFWGEVGVEARKLGVEYVVEIEGLVKVRSAGTVNPDLETGKIEIEGQKITVLNVSKTPPFELNKDTSSVDEALRLKYRYLDLRSERVSKNIKLRSEFVRRSREFLFKNDFCEIETPLLTKSTPEGSRDFVVPSRLQPGKFYALPQSPQQYKQLLMTAGFERYFQTARAIRDEDLRADRGFEHTQIDLEMSFVKRDDVMNMVEEMITTVVEGMGYKIKEKPFPRVTYKESMEKYGADKFDLRNEEDKKNGVLAYAWVVEFPFFEKTDDGKWTFSHNPFSMPTEEHVEWLMNGKNIDQIMTTQYDLICNGYESGGGSIRAHKAEILEATYKVMGYSKEEVQESVGHMLEAFGLGTPPHGGIAIGVERSIMNLTNEKYLREVQAFPMTGNGQTSVMDAPSELSEKQLKELGILTAEKYKKVEGKDVYENILGLLDKNDIKYQKYEHEPVFTSEESAKVRGTEIHQGAKALVLQADKEFIMLVLPADLKADLESFQKNKSYKKLVMASKESVKAKTGLEVGCIPPFGSLLGLKTFVDSRLSDNEEIAFNAGRHDRSIKMKYEDYLITERPEVVNL